MNRRLAYSGLSSLLVVGTVLACGSSKAPGDADDGSVAVGGGAQQGDGNADGNPSGSGGTQGGGDDNSEDGLIVDDDGSGATGQVAFNGGVQVLTPDQVAELTESECAGFSDTPDVYLPTLQLIVDKSMSMNDPPCVDMGGSGGAPGAGGSMGAGGGIGPGPGPGPGPGGGCVTGGNYPPEPVEGSKWLLSVPPMLAALDAFPDGMSVGMLLFPTADSSRGRDECVSDQSMIPIETLGAAGSMQRAALANALTTVNLVYNTPTHDALHFALTESLEPYEGGGAKFVVLLTDGAPTQALGCGMPQGSATAPLQPILDEVAAAAAKGIKTYILGSPGSEKNGQTGEDMRPFLSEAAKLGGTAPDGCQIDSAPYCHFDMSATPDFAAALADALGKVTTGVVDACTFVIPEDIGSQSQEFDVSRTNLIMKKGDGSQVLVLRDDSPADCSEGWTLNGNQIVLCPTTCDAYKADATAEVTLSFGCNAIQPIS